MTFANPLFLAGTALVALPIVLHLIMRQRPKLLEFPALRFIRKRHDVNRRRLLLRHILLLLLRAGAIALLAFALALPSIHFSGVLGSQEAPVAAVLVFDTSPRMEYRHDNKTRMQTAREIGQWIVAQLPDKSELAVIDTRALPGEPYSEDPSEAEIAGLDATVAPGVLHDDRGLAKQQIERLTSVADSLPVTGALKRALQLAAGSDLARKEIYVFTDLSRMAWPGDSAAALRSALADASGASIYLIDVGVVEPSNFALAELRLSREVLSSRSTLGIETVLSHTGPPGERTVELYLFDEKGQKQKRDEVSHTLESGEARHVPFRVGSLGPGTHQGVVQIVGQDALPCDDERYFTVEVRPAWRILVAAPEPTDRHAVYLTQALSPEDFRKRGHARFECEVVTFEQLARQPLEDYAAVCLLDPSPLDAKVWQKLEQHAAQGNGVAIFLGRNAVPVRSFNTPHAQALLPGRLLRKALAGDWDLSLEPRNYQHLVLAEFPAGAEVPWQLFPVRSYWQLEDMTAGVVIPYSNGRPALLERQVGKGRVLTMTTPISDGPNQPWNYLTFLDPWPFGMLVNGMASYLVGSSHQRLNYRAGQTAVLQLDDRTRRSKYWLIRPDALELKVTVEPPWRELIVHPRNADQVGNYRVRADGVAEVDRGFSVNLDPEQTRLGRIPEEELAGLFEPYTYRLARTRQEIEGAQQRGRAGRELFPMLILVVALVLAAEHVVANRFYRD